MGNVNINYSGFDITDGRGADAYLSISNNTPRASFRKGADGNTSASLSSDHSVTLTLTYFPESETANGLQFLYYSLKKLERAGQPILGSFPLIMEDPSGSIAFAAKDAVLMNLGDISLGEDTGEVELEFYVEDAAQIAYADEYQQVLSGLLAPLNLPI